MDKQVMIEQIVKEVVAKMQIQSKQTTFSNDIIIICDHVDSYNYYKDKLELLHHHHIYYDVLLVDEEITSTVKHNMFHIESGNIYCGTKNAATYIELANKYNIFILPEIKLSDSARIATATNGNYLSDLLYTANILEKQIMIGKQATGLSYKETVLYQKKELPKAYVALFKQYCRTLTALGIKFIDLKKIKETVEMKLTYNVNYSHKQYGEKYDDGYVFEGKFLSLQWLEQRQFRPNQKIYVKQTTIISPLVKDEIKAMNYILCYIE